MKTQERRKLFSSSTTPPVRRKLFTDNNVSSPTIEEKGTKEKNLRTVICLDCGYVTTTDKTTTHLFCPKCGGHRFNVISKMTNPEPIKEKAVRRSLFKKSKEEAAGIVNEEEGQKEFSEPSNEFEKKLKVYSGKILSGDEVDRLFSDTGNNVEDLIQKGFAEVTEDNKVKIYDTAYLQSKLFSKLIISVTKILDLDPIDKPKREIIEELAEKRCMEPKSIMLIKKAHSISPIIRESGFSETDEWIKDSGIQNDLHLEFGDSQMDLQKFKDILAERYDDAPEDIIDKLKENNIIKVYGDQVEIL